MRFRKILGCTLVGAAISMAIVGVDAEPITFIAAGILPTYGLLLLFWEG